MKNFIRKLALCEIKNGRVFVDLTGSWHELYKSLYGAGLTSIDYSKIHVVKSGEIELVQK